MDRTTFQDTLATPIPEWLSPDAGGAGMGASPVLTAASLDDLPISLDPEGAGLEPALGSPTREPEAGPGRGLSFAGGIAFPYFTRIVVPNSIDEVAEKYVSWALGKGEFANLRGRRAEQGIQEGWEVRGSLESVDFAGKDGLLISVRATRGLWAFRFVHPEEAPDGNRSRKVTWWNVARITPAGSGCQIEHAIIRQTPTPEPFPGHGMVPVVIKSLLDAAPMQGGGLKMGRVPQLLRADEATLWAKDILLSPGRQAPALVVSRPRDARERHLVDGDHLARVLQGMAGVVLLDDKRAAWAIQDVLGDHGFDPKRLGCYNGAVRIYQPGMAPDSTGEFDHRVWTSNALESKPHDQRIAAISSEVIRSTVGANLPPRFIMAVEEVDRRIHTEQAEQSRQRASELQHAHATDQIQQLEAEVVDLKGEIERMVGEVSYMEKLVELGDTEIANIRRENEELAKKLYVANSTAEAMTNHANGASNIGRMKSNRPGPEVLDAMDAVMTGEPNLVQALTYLEWRYPERIRIHEKAWSSARKATDAHFKYKEQAFGLLKSLATDYWEAMSKGGAGDAEARKAFGAKYAGLESETTMGTKRAKDLRERTFDGKSYPMWRHLKIGVSETATEGWRCHFDIDPDTGTILVGHCGEHLDLR